MCGPYCMKECDNLINEDFRFGSKWLSEFSMIMCTPEDEQEFVTKTINRGEITPVRSKPNHYSVSYNDTLLLNFFIMKKDGCYRQEDFIMSGDELHYIRSWLESPKRPTELVVPENEDEITTYYYGLFTSVQPYVIDGYCYGLNLEFTCDSPYGYTGENEATYTGTFEETTPVVVTYKNNSAEQFEYLKPVVSITSSNTFGSDEWITITNVDDREKEMTISLPSGLSEIIIDCNKKTVTDGDGNLLSMSDIGVTTPVSSEYSLISTDMYIFYWLSLIHGENELSITASDTNTINEVKIKARFVVKTGGF